jgi:outer membrane protein assembly factor BamB
VRLVHVYRSLDTVWVQAFASDKRGAFSSSDSARLIVGEAGAVFKWWTANPPGQPDFAGSPVIVNDGYGELAYVLAGDSLVTLRLFGYGPGYRAGIAEGALVGHPVFSPATGHIYIGSDVGRLYAFDSQLHLAWFYPESLTALEWGTVAVNGSQLYVGHSDDSLVHLQDNGDSVTRIGSYHLGATAVDAPAIDAAGNVYIGTDSGYLCKFDADLGLQWNLRLAPSDEVYGPVLGSDHIVYCGGGTDKLYATNTDGSQKWVWPAGSGVSRPAVASDGNVLVGTASGRFCKLNRFTGVPLWEDSIGSASFVTTPIVVQNGYLYAQNEDGVLYCLGQSTGDVIWYCDCPATVPLATRSGRARQTNDFLANPTITAGGNIVVIGSDVVYLVKGYPTRPLDPRAPWPKWQHDLYNSGNVSGGR